jgi:hypothetical protein
MGIGAAVFGVSTVAILGAHWMDWPRLVVQVGSQQAGGAVGLPGLFASLWGNAAGFLSFAIAAVLAMAASWGLRDDPQLAVAAAVCVSLLLAPHVFPTDLLLLSPALALAGRPLPVTSAIAALLLSVAYVVGTLPPILFGLDAYTPALVVIVVVVVVVLVRRPSHRHAGLATLS